MKKIFLSIVTLLFLVSCHDEVKFNNPGFQAVINGELWKANTKNILRNSNGSITLNGFSKSHQLQLTLSSANVGTYPLGTTNTNNFIVLTPLNNTSIKFSTLPSNGGAFDITLNNPGSGYSTSNIVSTTGGSGTGLKLNIEANTSGNITKVTVNVPGTGYRAGDILTIASGNANATIVVKNTTNSNGEVKITENTGSTISGSFKFTAFDSNTGTNISCKEGIFYKLPL